MCDDWKKAIDEIRQTACALDGFYEDAFDSFYHQVAYICVELRPEEEVERLLDYMLGFCSSPNILRLFKTVCRQYFLRYPEMIVYQITSYKEMYEED